jgi:hypothetical protein
MTSKPESSGHPALYVLLGLAAVILALPGLLWFNANQELGRFQQSKVCDKNIEDRDLSAQCRQSLKLRVTGLVSKGSRRGLEVKLPNGTSQLAYIKDEEPQKIVFQQKPQHVIIELWKSEIMAIKVGEKFAITEDNPKYKASNAQGGFLGLMVIGGGIFTIFVVGDVLNHMWDAMKQKR